MNLVFENKIKQLNLYIDSGNVDHESDRVCVSPFANRLNVLSNYQNRVHQKNTFDFINFNNSPFSVNRYDIDSIPEGVKYIIPVGVHQSPTHWAGYGPGQSSIFESINPLYLQHLREGRAHILFDNSLEGYEDIRLYDFLHQQSIKYNIPIKNIIYTSGNSELEVRVKEWEQKTGLEGPIVFGYTHFEFDMYFNSQYFNDIGQFIPTYDDHVKYKKANLPILKTYNCLNRKPRQHRIAFFNQLFHAGMIPYGLVSMNDWRNEINHDLVKVDNYKPDRDELEHSVQFTPMHWNNLGNLENSSDKINRLNEKSMLDSWITVVSEAQYEDKQGSIFLSEKTFKPIACSHPFVILGAKGSLKELHKLGYITFDNLIDESYDELDSRERFEALIHIIRNLSDNPDPLQWLGWCKDRLIHNKKVLEFNSIYNPPQGFHLLYNLCKQK
jgi:hypothetical protein